MKLNKEKISKFNGQCFITRLCGFDDILIFFLTCVVFAYAYAPEDSNCQYLLDKQLAHYFQTWEVFFDSSTNVFRTSQGCLDLLNWYIDLQLRYEAYLSQILGIRYQNHYLGDYDEHISNHYFQPFFQLRNDQRLFLSITTHYYKGEDEIGVGYFWGENYLNYMEMFFIVEDFDRNFSLQHTEEGRGKIIYKDLNYPMKIKVIMNKNWKGGRFRTEISLGKKYRLESTDEPITYIECGYSNFWYFRFWQDIGKFRLGLLNTLKWSAKSLTDSDFHYDETVLEELPEIQFTYRINKKWIPNLYLTYNYKNENDTIFYKRHIYAYLVDLELYPGGNFIWHFGTQRQFYYNNQNRNFKERRINLGLEYHYKNLWFYLVEAMEGDFPTPKYLHNHTYVQLMMRF
uniref:Alginate export domain-containing protein n=1 Tax=candidate division WOR-3 bacterium TaxID=2052148 RepID=A0A7C4X9P9_UNCW3